MALCTDYLIHERSYQRKRRNPDFVGWMDRVNTESHLAAVGEWMAAVPPCRLLELGCGAGDQSLYLAARGFDCVGVDIAPTAVAWAQEKAASEGLAAKFHVGDVLALPFPDASFDHVLDGSCWHCIIGEDRGRFLAEAARVLRPGGTFTTITMINGCKYAGAMEYDAERRIQWMEGFAVRYWTTEAEVLRDAAAAGLEVARSKIRGVSESYPEEILFIDLIL